MSGVMARLDWAMGCHVLCGVIDCGADIASVVAFRYRPTLNPMNPG